MARDPGSGPLSPFQRAIAGLAQRFPALGGIQSVRSFVPLLIGMAIVGLLVFVQISSTPQFCGTCHIMKPYFQSWKHSSHNQIACVECHISPGLTAEVRKKFEALSMVAKYFTATYGTKPWAEVDDAACLKCHQRRLLEGRVIFRGVTFDHRPHLTESRRGLRLRCTSCHSQIVQGTHLTVTTSTCALCHFKDQGPNQGLGACKKCHEVPDRVQITATVAFDHSEVTRRDMNCASCHGDVVRGVGEVARERCLGCHNQPDRLAKYGDKLYLHRMHVTEHKVDCQDCHSQIEHGTVSRVPGSPFRPEPRPPHGDVVKNRKPEKADGLALAGVTHAEDILPAAPDASHKRAPNPCEVCHGSGHSPQQQLYSGRGGRGVPDMPSPMYVTGVTCQGCHNPEYSVRVASLEEGGPEHTPATVVSCMACHGPTYRRIYLGWKQAVDERTNALRNVMQANVGVMGMDPPPAWEDARANFSLVSKGRGVHNVNYSYALLDKAFDQLNEARAARGLPAASRPWAAASKSACMSCHLGIERQSGTFAGSAFSHLPHLTTAKLECEKCHRKHSERPKVEVVSYGPAGCTSCHHQGLTKDSFKDCTRCHTDVNTRTIRTERGEFSHRAHRENAEECTTCHTLQGGDPRPTRAACKECHD